METKERTRKECLALRRQLTTGEAAAGSQRICTRLQKILRRISSDIDDSREKPILLVYAAIHKEADLSSLVEWALGEGFPVAYPAVRLPENNHDQALPCRDMDFYRVTDPRELVVSESYHIPEPEPVKDKLVYPKAEDIILVPGAAFSREGDRVGYGGGFYDTYFERFPDSLRVGICYQLQLHDRWATDPHDMTMDLVITEEEEIMIDERIRSYM